MRQIAVSPLASASLLVLSIPGYFLAKRTQLKPMGVAQNETATASRRFCLPGQHILEFRFFGCHSQMERNKTGTTKLRLSVSAGWKKSNRPRGALSLSFSAAEQSCQNGNAGWRSAVALGWLPVEIRRVLS